MNHRESDGRGVSRRFQVNFAALPQHLAAIALDDPRYDLHERGFTGTVFAEKQMHFAGLHGQRPVDEGGNTAVAFFDVVEFEEHPKRTSLLYLAEGEGEIKNGSK